MNMITRAGLVLVISIAGLGGCSAARTANDAGAARLSHPRPPAGLDDYKVRVARHVADHNPDRAYAGTLPAMLPAIVVLDITVERDGRLAGVAVRRSRDPAASAIALASVRRSAPLPPPQQLARGAGKLTFSETFLFADSARYQLRSLAGPQASD